MKRKAARRTKPPLTPGARMRAIRMGRGLTMRDVERGCAGITFRTRATKYFVRRSQLSAYENDKLVPSIFKLYALSSVYRCKLRTLLSCYLPSLTGR